ncbi:MAG: deoxyribodipyrimidine photo-lyase [Alphaproteobacteria bacterium]|nr:deoxyribodipyrimidine photo-lyase [Alphaproteobacteria bacterium]
MKPIIVWFRRDLRLADNPALSFAAKSGRPVVCLYILDDDAPGEWKWGGAARWWLHHSLAALDQSLCRHGGGLVLRRGRAGKILPAVIEETGAEAAAWNRCYEPYAVARDTALKQQLAGGKIDVQSFNASLLFEPWEVATKDGKPFRVFTPFWNALRGKSEPGKPHPAPRKLAFHAKPESETLSDWKLLPAKPNWAKNFDWTPGETAARRALSSFLGDISHYATMRDIPGRDGTSQLSPHLNWGEIGPRQIWHAVKSHAHARSDGAQAFLKELGWREFCSQLLFHNPNLPDSAFDARFNHFPWRRSEKDFTAWTRGRTGIPIVDAGMRQLWQTGWMHNRVRMITASLLIKHLGIHWKRGEEWFWDTLVDAGLANNAANWQWVAGSGADAAPFFRIFNPVLQGQKFDPGGDYVRRYVPELKNVPDRYIHHPWDAPTPPPDYPPPIVDLDQGRMRALESFRSISKVEALPGDI